MTLFDILFSKLPIDIRLRLMDLYQNPQYHAEGSIMNHMQLVSNNLPDELNIQTCVLFHDLGKIDTHKVYETKNSTIKIQHIGHEHYVPSYVAHLANLYSDLNINWDMVIEVGLNHMRMHKYVTDELSKSKRLKMEALKYFKELQMFCEADNKGRMTRGGLPYLIITIGIPGSGKSTWANSFSKINGYTIINPDSIRKEITGSISDQSKNAEVWNKAYSLLDTYLVSGISVIFDSTAVNKKTLDSLINHGKNKAIILYKFFDCDPILAKQRIKNDLVNGVIRSNVPDDVIDRMYGQYHEVHEMLKDNSYIITTKE